MKFYTVERTRVVGMTRVQNVSVYSVKKVRTNGAAGDREWREKYFTSNKRIFVVALVFTNEGSWSVDFLALESRQRVI